MRDHILESVFLDTSLWKEGVDHGVDKHISSQLMEKFADPHFRADLCCAVGSGEYSIKPPHTGYRKKDDGGERMFLINEPDDRVLLNVIYRWLARNEARMIHPACKSYQSGIGVGKIVQNISRQIVNYSDSAKDVIVGRKFDIQKYFESVDRNRIHEALNQVKLHHGDSSILDLLHEYYDSDVYYDSRKKEFVSEYQGIKQGCAVSAWLANVLLYPLDEVLSKRKGLYVRYSDDILYIGEDYEEVTKMINEILSGYGLKLNEKKITDIYSGKYFRFLGFDICGDRITLSRKWVKNFQHEVDRRTILDTRLIKRVRTLRKMGDKTEPQLRRIVDSTVRRLVKYLYVGDGRFSWATQVLPTVNNLHDIRQLNLYCLDAIRAVYTGHTHIGGLGKSLEHDIQRGKGRNVKSNIEATKHLTGDGDSAGRVDGFVSLLSMKDAIGNKWLARTIASNLIDTRGHPVYGQVSGQISESKEEIIEELEQLYEEYMNSIPDGETTGRFYACSLDEMTMEMMITGSSRSKSLKILENFLRDKVGEMMIFAEEKQWYWQSETIPQLVLIREWFKK